MNKKLLFVPFPLICVLLLSSCNKTILNLPTFKKSKGITFTAYAGPTVANWNGSIGNVNTITDENYKKIAEAGFNKVIALYEGASSVGGKDIYDLIANKSKKAESDALLALPLAEKYNLKYIVRDWSYYGLTKNYESQGITDSTHYEKIINKMFDENNQYIKYSSYGGNFGDDEPNYQHLDLIAEQVRLYNNKMKEYGINGETLINLNPSYVGGPSLSTDSTITYSDYIDKYFEVLAPQLGYVSYDYYPFKGDFYDGSYIRNGYLRNFELMAEHCKGTNVELRSFIQATGDFTGIRDITTIGDFRFQIYCGLAFGTREFTYYKYVGETSAKDGEYSLMNYMTGEYNFTYDLAKKANNEIHAFEDALLAYNYDAVTYKNADPMFENMGFNNLETALDEFEKVKIISCKEDTLLTRLKDKNNKEAYMLVNYVDPYFQKNNDITLSFEGAKGLLMYRLGQKTIVELPGDGKYTFKLYPGEGRFIIPLY